MGEAALKSDLVLRFFLLCEISCMTFISRQGLVEKCSLSASKFHGATSLESIAKKSSRENCFKGEVGDLDLQGKNNYWRGALGEPEIVSCMSVEERGF